MANDQESGQPEDDGGRWKSEEDYRSEIRRERKKRCLFTFLTLVVIGAGLGYLLGSEGLSSVNKTPALKGDDNGKDPPGSDTVTESPVLSPTIVTSIPFTPITAAPTGTPFPSYAPVAPIILGGDAVINDESNPNATIDVSKVAVSFDNTTLYSSVNLHKPTGNWNATLFMIDDGGTDAIELKQEGFTVRRVENRRNLQSGTELFSGNYISLDGLSVVFAAPIDIFGDLPSAKIWMDAPGDRIPDEGFASFELNKEFPPTPPPKTRAPVAPPTLAPPVTPGTPTDSSAPATPGTPSEPGAPTVPGTPIEPGAPTVSPGTPTDPGAPTLPQAPVVPGEPTVSPAPVVPGAPTVSPAPVVPGTPTVSSAPVVPGAPSVSPAPVVPGAPTVSPAPVVQGAPSVSPAPVVPGAPTVSPASVVPGEPTVSLAPVVPGTPTEAPVTKVPTTKAPTKTPTPRPTKVPTTKAPTKTPTPPPTKVPTTKKPTLFPTMTPSFSPTTLEPSSRPTGAPSVTPTMFPTTSPTFFPTGVDQTSKTCIRSTDVCGDSSNGALDWEELKCAISDTSLICTLTACNKIFASDQAVGEVYFNAGKNVVQLFKTFVLWNEVSDGSIVQLRNGEFALSGNEKEYRFIFPLEFTPINESEEVFALVRKFDGADVFDRFPNPGQSSLLFTPSQC